MADPAPRLATDLPPRMTPEQRAALDRRRRGRNWALLLTLLGLVVLFYCVTVAKIMSPAG